MVLVGSCAAFAGIGEGQLYGSAIANGWDSSGPRRFIRATGSMEVHMLVQAGAKPADQSHSADVQRCPAHLRRTEAVGSGQ